MFLPAAGSRVPAGNPSILLPCSTGRRAPLLWSRHSIPGFVEDDVWENRKKANALPGAGVFHTVEQLPPRLTKLRGAFSSRSLFYGDPGLVSWVKCRTKANPRLWSVWRFHVPRIWNWSIVPCGVGVKRKSQNLDNFFFTRLYLVVRFPARRSDFLRLPSLSFS